MDGIAYGVPLGEGLQNFKPSCLSTAVFLFSALPRKEVFGSWHKIKKPCIRKVFHFGGEKGIRTPGPVTVNGFQDRRIRPLCHLSGAKV